MRRRLSEVSLTSRWLRSMFVSALKWSDHLPNSAHILSREASQHQANLFEKRVNLSSPLSFNKNGLQYEDSRERARFMNERRQVSQGEKWAETIMDRLSSEGFRWSDQRRMV